MNCSLKRLIKKNRYSQNLVNQFYINNVTNAMLLFGILSLQCNILLKL